MFLVSYPLISYSRADLDKPILFKDWGLRYQRPRSYRDRVRIIKQQLIPFFGSAFLAEIRQEMKSVMETNGVRKISEALSQRRHPARAAR